MRRWRSGNFLGSVSDVVAFDPEITPSAKAVYLVLVMHRNDATNQCYPSNRTLCAYTGLSESTVRRALNELVGKRILSREAEYDADGRQRTSRVTLSDVRTGAFGGEVDQVEGEGVTGDTPPPSF